MDFEKAKEVYNNFLSDNNDTVHGDMKLGFLLDFKFDTKKDKLKFYTYLYKLESSDVYFINSVNQTIIELKKKSIFEKLKEFFMRDPELFPVTIGLCLIILLIISKIVINNSTPKINYNQVIGTTNEIVNINALIYGDKYNTKLIAFNNIKNIKKENLNLAIKNCILFIYRQNIPQKLLKMLILNNKDHTDFIHHLFLRKQNINIENFKLLLKYTKDIKILNIISCQINDKKFNKILKARIEELGNDHIFSVEIKASK